MSDILATKHLGQVRLPVPGSALTTVLLAVVVVVSLYFGREVLVPIALAVLMSFVLAPPVRRLQAWYVPRILAVILVVFGRICGHLQPGRVDGFSSKSARDRSAPIPIDAARKD